MSDTTNDDVIGDDVKQSRVYVALRVRPLGGTQKTAGCFEIKPSAPNDMILHRTRVQPPLPSGVAAGDPVYKFDDIFTDASTQIGVFEQACEPAIFHVLEGYNAVVMVYGQTGSGKTHTMSGPEGGLALQMSTSQINQLRTEETTRIVAQYGMLPNTVFALLERCEQDRASADYVVTMFVCELYNEQINDLCVDAATDEEALRLGANLAVSATSDGVSIRDISEIVIYDSNEMAKVEAAARAEAAAENINATPEQLDSAASQKRDLRCAVLEDTALDWIGTATRRRTTAATAMNADSSRSHMIVRFTVHRTATAAGDYTRSTLFLVDLAGNERLSESKVVGQQSVEARNINKSLMFLSQVVQDISEGRTPTTYRNSVLTTLLRPALSGSALTRMVVTISKSREHLESSLRSMDFARRAKCIKVSAARQVVPDTDSLAAQNAALMMRIDELQAQLTTALEAAAAPSMSTDQFSDAIGAAVYEAQLAQLKKRIEDEHATKQRLVEERAAMLRDLSKLRTENKELMAHNAKLTEERDEAQSSAGDNEQLIMEMLNKQQKDVVVAATAASSSPDTFQDATAAALRDGYANDPRTIEWSFMRNLTQASDETLRKLELLHQALLSQAVSINNLQATTRQGQLVVESTLRTIGNSVPPSSSASSRVNVAATAAAAADELTKQRVQSRRQSVRRSVVWGQQAAATGETSSASVSDAIAGPVVTPFTEIPKAAPPTTTVAAAQQQVGRTRTTVAAAQWDQRITQTAEAAQSATAGRMRKSKLMRVGAHQVFPVGGGAGVSSPSAQMLSRRP